MKGIYETHCTAHKYRTKQKQWGMKKVYSWYLRKNKKHAYTQRNLFLILYFLEI